MKTIFFDVDFKDYNLKHTLNVALNKTKKFGRVLTSVTPPDTFWNFVVFNEFSLIPENLNCWEFLNKKSGERIIIQKVNLKF